MKKRIRRALKRSLMPGNIWRNITISVVVVSVLVFVFHLTTHLGTLGRYAGELTLNFIIMTLIDSIINYVRDVQPNE